MSYNRRLALRITNVLDVLAITGPIYLLMAAGYAATRAGLFERAELRVFGKYVIHLALPVLNLGFVAAYALGSAVTMAVGIVWALRVGRKRLSAAAIMGMGMSCPNSGFIGFPLVAQMFGAATAGVGLALAMIVENFLLLPLALALADAEPAPGSSASTRGARIRAALAQSLRGIVRNPMIHGIALGFLFSVLGWHLPAPMQRAIDLLAMSCAAISLFVVGGSLVGLQLRGLGSDVIAVAAGKLLLHPVAVLAVVLLMPGMEHDLQRAVVLMAAVPMLSIYPILAQKHGHDAMAAAAQLGTTVMSFFTLTSLVWLLKSGLN